MKAPQEESIRELIKRLRNTSNWLREEYGQWKSSTSHYDRTPFEAADVLETLLTKRL